MMSQWLSETLNLLLSWTKYKFKATGQHICLVLRQNFSYNVQNKKNTFGLCNLRSTQSYLCPLSFRKSGL